MSRCGPLGLYELKFHMNNVKMNLVANKISYIREEASEVVICEGKYPPWTASLAMAIDIIRARYLYRKQLSQQEFFMPPEVPEEATLNLTGLVRVEVSLYPSTHGAPGPARRKTIPSRGVDREKENIEWRWGLRRLDSDYPSSSGSDSDDSVGRPRSGSDVKDPGGVVFSTKWTDIPLSEV